MTRASGHPSATAAMIVPALLAAAVYRELPRLYFFADDFACLFRMANEGVLRFLVQPFGGHVLVVRNLAMYVCWRLFGLDAAGWGWVMLLTHTVNVALLARVVLRLTSRPFLAAFTAGLWGTSPVNAGALGWYAVYGQVLGTTVLLLLLDGVIASAGHATTATAVGWCALALAGATCFGTGIAVAIVFPLVAVLLAPGLRGTRAGRVLLALPAATVALYAGLLGLAARVGPPSMDQAILFATFYRRPGATIAMFVDLVGFGMTSTVLSFATVGRTFPGVLTVLGALGYVAVVALGAAGDRRHRRTIAAALLVAGAVYALVATGRAATYANFGRDLAAAAAVARYHYLAGVPLVLALGVAVDALAAMPRAGRLVVGGVVAWMLFLAVAWARTDWRLELREAPRRWVATTLATIDASVDAAPPGGTVVVENRPAPPEVLGVVLPRAAFPGAAALFVVAHPADEVRGRRVRFVERNAAAWAQSRASGGRLDALLAGPEDAPPTIPVAP